MPAFNAAFLLSRPPPSKAVTWYREGSTDHSRYSNLYTHTLSHHPSTVLAVPEDMSSISTRVWDSAILLPYTIFASLKTPAPLLRPASVVLEIGAGTGITSLILAASAPHFPGLIKSLTATEYSTHLLDRLTDLYTAHATIERLPITVLPLDWYNPADLPPLAPPSLTNIVVSDCTVTPHDVPPLLTVLEDLSVMVCSARIAAGSPYAPCSVIIAYPVTREGTLRLLNMAPTRWDVTAVAAGHPEYPRDGKFGVIVMTLQPGVAARRLEQSGVNRAAVVEHCGVDGGGAEELQPGDLRVVRHEGVEEWYVVVPVSGLREVTGRYSDKIVHGIVVSTGAMDECKEAVERVRRVGWGDGNSVASWTGGVGEVRGNVLGVALQGQSGGNSTWDPFVQLAYVAPEDAADACSRVCEGTEWGSVTAEGVEVWRRKGGEFTYVEGGPVWQGVDAGLSLAAGKSGVCDSLGVFSEKWYPSDAFLGVYMGAVSDECEDDNFYFFEVTSALGIDGKLGGNWTR